MFCYNQAGRKMQQHQKLGCLGLSPQTGWTRGQRHTPLYVWWPGEMRKTVYFTCLVVVLELRHISSTGLCYPLACHQVAHYHRSGTDFCPAQPQYSQHHTWVKLEFIPAGMIKLQWDMNSFWSWFHTWSSLGHFGVYLAVSVLAWAGWSHMCVDTWGHYKGAKHLPGSAVWSQIYGCLPGEPLEAC